MVTTFPSQSYLSPYTVPFAVQPVGSIPHRPSAVTQTLSHNCPMYSYPAPRQPVGSTLSSSTLSSSITIRCPTTILNKESSCISQSYSGSISNTRVAILSSTDIGLFWCGNTLRQEGIFQQHLTTWLVSKMVREWSYQGIAQSKLANVYFHCKVACVKRKKPDFEGHLCTVPAQIGAYLQESHRQYLRNHFGL